MIKNISDKFSKIRNDIDASSGVLFNDNARDFFLRANSNYSDAASNPFEKSEKETKIQEYFNSKYFKINSKIKDTVYRITDKNGDIKNFIDDTILDFSASVSKFYYDSDFKLSINDNRDYSLSKDKNINILTVKGADYTAQIEFTKTSFVKISVSKNFNEKSIIFRKQNFLQKTFNIAGNNIKKYEKFDSSGNKLEEVYFNKYKKPDKYVKFRAGKKEFEITFDASDWQYMAEKSYKIPNAIPLEYCGYDFCENETERLSFQYARPSKYLEFNSNTGKIIKSFNLQGLSSMVSKYAFYNSLTGQVLAFGTL